MAEFDSGMIERYAASLHRRGARRVTRGVVAGGIVGAAIGAFPFFHVVSTTLPHRYWYALVLAGAAAGVYVGYAIGESRAVGLRLQAQLALHQLRIEAMLLDRTAAPAPVAAPVPAVEAAPEPEPEPEPVAVPVLPPVVAAFPAPHLAPPDEPPISAVS